MAQPETKPGGEENASPVMGQGVLNTEWIHGILDAKLILYQASSWSPGGRKAIANWLRDQADQLEMQGQHYSDIFTANRDH